MRLIAILLIFLSVNSYSQNFFKFSGKGRAIRVERRIVTHRTNARLARNVLRAVDRERRNRKTVTLLRTRQEAIRSPLRVVGPNAYLKGIGRRFKGQNEWNRINKADGYNGAHHIVTKFVIKELGGNEECISNAPSVFHPNHNNPEYIDVFHNHSKQMELYKKGGVRAIIDDFFNNVPDYSKMDQKQIMLEGELWSKHWGFRWN